MEEYKVIDYELIRLCFEYKRKNAKKGTAIVGLRINSENQLSLTVGLEKQQGRLKGQEYDSVLKILIEDKVVYRTKIEFDYQTKKFKSEFCVPKHYYDDIINLLENEIKKETLININKEDLIEPEIIKFLKKK